MTNPTVRVLLGSASSSRLTSPSQGCDAQSYSTSTKSEAIVESMGRSFTPKQLIQRTQGKDTYLSYPDVTSSMTQDEKAYAYQQNLSQLESSDLSLKTKMHIMATLHDGKTQHDVTWNKLKKDGYDELLKISNMTLVSYHDLAGNRIANATDASGHLIPTAASAPTRPENINFVKVKSTINLQHLHPGSSAVSVVFCLRLPTSTFTINTGVFGSRASCETTNVRSDWLSQPQSVFEAEILNHPLAEPKPFIFEKPEYGNTEAKLNSDRVQKDIDEALRKIAYPLINKKILAQLCPSYASNPIKCVNQMSQVSIGSDGKQSVSTVTEFYNAMKHAILILTQPDGTLKMDAHYHYVEHLAPKIKNELEKSYTKHQDPQSLDALTQTDLLDEAHQRAVLAERSITDYIDISTEANAGQHGLLFREKAQRLPSTVQQREPWSSNLRKNAGDASRRIIVGTIHVPVKLSALKRTIPSVRPEPPKSLRHSRSARSSVRILGGPERGRNVTKRTGR